MTQKDRIQNIKDLLKAAKWRITPVFTTDTPNTKYHQYRQFYFLGFKFKFSTLALRGEEIMPDVAVAIRAPDSFVRAHRKFPLES